MSSPRHKRTRTGCLTCRARKIKCSGFDDGANICTNCSRSSLDCLRSANESLRQETRSRLAVSAENSHFQLTQAGIRRRRIRRSCVACKLLKKRCNGERPQCERCLERRQACVYDGHDPVSASGGDMPLPPQRPQGTLPSMSDSMATASNNSLSPASTLSSVLSPLSPAGPAAATTTVNLPDQALARNLCDAFFDEIAPLRCLGFLHRHNFLQHAQECVLEDTLDPLLLAVCALGTKTIRRRDLWEQGSVWAQLVHQIVLAELQDISVRRLMCVVLLYEHAARTSEHRLCFMLSGLASRYSQALSLNLEYDHDVLSTGSGGMSAVERESRRRLMWSCYIMDTQVACGLNHLQVIDTTTIQIQLPCDDKYFLYKVARTTARVPMRFDATAGDDNNNNNNEPVRIPTENQDTHAFLLRLFLVRERILRYINDHTDEEDPWRLTSSLADLEVWKESLPPELQFNSDVMNIRRDQSMLSALVSLHVFYHQVNCLLYRCTIPSMLFPARAQTGLSRKASVDFLSESRRGWFDHACAMTTIFEVALEQRPQSMTDPDVGPSAYNAIIIKFLYLTNFVPPHERLSTLERIFPLIKIDLRFLEELQAYHPSANSIFLAAEHLVQDARTRITQDPTVVLSESGNTVGIMSFPTDSISLDHRTNSLSTVARMRKSLDDVHAPDRAAVPLSRDGQSPGEPERLWVWITS